MSIDWILILEKLILIAVIVTVSLVIAMYETWGERKVAALIQDRRGPMRAGPMGLFQPLADGLKLFMKEDIIPNSSNKVLFILGPCLAMMAAMMTSAVIPFGGSVEVFGRTVELQIADVNVGVLYVFAVVSLGVYGIMIGGWASNNKFSLMAALRAASQAISYELAMGLALIALLFMSGSLSMRQIVEEQMKGGWGGFLGWNFLYQPVGFLIFLIASLAECNRTPFDLPEAESELNFGYHQEYSSMKLGFYLFAEYIAMFISCVLIATLYFGGYDMPFFDEAAHAHWGNWLAVIGIVALMAKVMFFIFLYMWIRWTIPRFRYDQLMNLGWNKLVPLALANMIITGAVVLWLNSR